MTIIAAPAGFSRKRLSQLRRRGAVVGQFGQRLFAEQGGGKGIENVAEAVSRTKDDPPAEAHAFDHAGTRQGRQHARPNKR